LITRPLLLLLLPLLKMKSVVEGDYSEKKFASNLYRRLPLPPLHCVMESVLRTMR